MFPWQTSKGEQTKWLHVKYDVRNAIANRHFAPGDRLPTEHQLAEAYKYSLSPVRQATKSLQDGGLIEIRGGSRGTYVTRDAYAKLGISTDTTKARKSDVEAKFGQRGAPDYRLDQPDDVTIYPGDELTIRRPTAAETKDHGLPRSEQLADLKRRDGTREIYRSPRTYPCQESPPAVE